MLFRRSKSESTAGGSSSAATDTSARVGAKGRPTPTRREAEAAAKARANLGKDKKSVKALQRERRVAQGAKVRQGMRTGDERYLPARDQGKVRRFVRDYVDARLSMAEFLLPLLIVVMVLSPINESLSGSVWSATILIVVLDTMLLVWRLKRELKKRFPDESYKGTTGYALLRVLQVRFLRLPKTQVKLGATLPERY